jgi:hypothetical protein
LANGGIVIQAYWFPKLLSFNGLRGPDWRKCLTNSYLQQTAKKNHFFLVLWGLLLYVYNIDRQLGLR